MLFHATPSVSGKISTSELYIFSNFTMPNALWNFGEFSKFAQYFCRFWKALKVHPRGTLQYECFLVDPDNISDHYQMRLNARVCSATLVDRISLVEG